MRLIKVFLAGIAGLFVFITLLSLLIPAHPKVVRTVVINGTSKEKVFAEVADLKNWKHWHPILASDSAVVNFSGAVNGKSAACDVIYRNKTVHIEITKMDTASLSFIVKAKGENDISNQVRFSSIPSSAQTKVDWVATTHLHWYPWEKFYAIFIDKLTGPGYEAALDNLKLYLESRP